MTERIISCTMPCCCRARSGPAGRLVFVVEDGLAQPRTIEIGTSLGNRFEVRSGLEPGEPRDINRRLGVTGADQNAAIAGAQRKDMPRRGDVAGG